MNQKIKSVLALVLTAFICATIIYFVYQLTK